MWVIISYLCVFLSLCDVKMLCKLRIENGCGVITDKRYSAWLSCPRQQKTVDPIKTQYISKLPGPLRVARLNPIFWEISGSRICILKPRSH